MSRRPPTSSSHAAVATGASAAGAASFGAMAVGAAALGALAIGALAIGRLAVGRARLRRVDIGELTVGRLDVRADGVAGTLTAVARVRATPGSGDALQQLLEDRIAEGAAGGLHYRAHRSLTDPDLFLLYESHGADAERRFGGIVETAAAQGLVIVSEEGPVETELYRAI